MDTEDDSSTSFMPEHLLKILTVLVKVEKCHPWKLICNSDSFTLSVNFPANIGDKHDKGKRKPFKKRTSGLMFASQHTAYGQETARFFRCQASRTTEAKEEETPCSSGKGSCQAEGSLEADESRQKAKC